MLVSVVIRLQATEPCERQQNLGRATHAWFLDRVRAADRTMAETLHRANTTRPFTVSNLWGTGRPAEGQMTLSPEQTCFLRLTSFGPELSALLQEQVLPALPETIELTGVPLRVVEVTTDPTTHPWAGTATFEGLVQEHLLATERPERKLTLRFASPTTFRRTGGDASLADSQGRAYQVAGHNVPLPLPGLVFDSYLQRWNAFAPVALPSDLKRYAQECVAISRYRLQTELVEFGAARQVGFVGSCQFMALVPDPYWLRLLHLLAAFAFYCGTGHKTTMGLGQTRQIPISKSQPPNPK